LNKCVQMRIVLL